MIEQEFIATQLKLDPFVPFTIVMDSGRTHHISSPGHAHIPPEGMAHHSTDKLWIVVYDTGGIPQYLACDHISSVEVRPSLEDIRPGESARDAHIRKLREMGYEPDLDAKPGKMSES